MRTLVLTEHFLPSVGGSINWLINTYSRYAPDEVVFVAPQEARHDASDRALPFRVERIPMRMFDWDPTRPSSLYRYLSLTWRVKKMCSKYRIQQVHCAKVLPEGLIAWCINALRYMPYLIYAHGEELQIGLASRKFQWLMPRIYNQAKCIIANSRNTKSLLLKCGIQPQKIYIIHPGVDVKRFRTDYAAGMGIRQRFNFVHRPILLTVGRLQRRKGHDMVIRALPTIQQRFPTIKYLIVGDGEELAYLKELSANIGVTESVIFVGRVSDAELPRYYSACDLLIMPNRQIDGDIEGFGMVYLEAAAAGKPVIGGRSGGTDDAILEGITGLRVDGNSAPEIADAVISLLAEPARMKIMGENGRRWVEQAFTWEAVVRRTQFLSIGVNGTNQRT
jgi:phosphatidyl-myo-inositol dimannoside synthase